MTIARWRYPALAESLAVDGSASCSGRAPCGDFIAVQAAIDAASAGATVELCADTDGAGGRGKR